MYVLGADERDLRWGRIRREMSERGLACLIVWGSAGAFRQHTGNLRYLSNVNTEGYLVFPLDGEPTLFSFLRKADPVSWVTDWRTGHPLYGKALSDRLRELHVERATIGLTGLSGYYAQVGFPHMTYVSLTAELPGVTLEDATDIIEHARLFKSPAEIHCLELGCEIADKVVETIAEVARPGVQDYEVRAAAMDAMFRNGGEPGGMLLFAAGKDVYHGGQGGYYAPPKKRPLESGDVILTEFDAIYQGYLAQYNQPFAVGKLDQEWERIFDVAIESFNRGVEALRPGCTAGGLDRSMIDVIERAGYIIRHPTYHGLGLSLEYPIGLFPAQPACEPQPDFVIERDMVIELEPHVVTKDGRRGLSFGIPAAVTETGCRLLSQTWKPEMLML